MSEQEKQALVTALRLLTATPKSRKGLQDKLKQKGYPPEVLDVTLDRLEKQGLLNDRALAQSLCQSYVNYKFSGRKRIAFELGKKGIRQNLIHEVLESYSPEEEKDKALELAKQKWDRWTRLDKMKRRKKVYDFLLRRGFDFNIARETIDKLLK